VGLNQPASYTLPYTVDPPTGRNRICTPPITRQERRDEGAVVAGSLSADTWTI